MKKNILFAIIHVFTFMPLFSSAQVNVQDSLALVDLYNSTDGPNWYNNNNWLTDEPVRSWTGISVVNNRVVKIAIVGNDLTGSIPSSIGNLTELTSLSLYGSGLNPNNLTGSIPISVGNLTALTHLNLSNSKLTGEIPASIGNLSSLISLDLSGNNLTGEIPATIGNLSSLMHLTLSSNNLTGNISSVIENLSELWSLTINNNKLSGDSSIMINNLSKLSRVTLYNNLFNFGDLEPFSSLDLSRFLYSPQDTLDLKAEIVGDSIRLTFDKASGTQTNYQWLKKNETGYYAGITTTAVNSYKIHKSENIQDWRCRAKNSLLTKLELIGLPPEGIEQPRDCWQAGQLTFCLNSGEWEKGSGTNKIKATNIISINDFLFFDGTMSIDTTVLEIEANGEFYVDNIPLPLGSIGKYTLLKGEHKLTLDGELGKLKDFLNSKLEVSAKLFGSPIKIEDLEFVKRNDTLGVNVGCSIQIPGISGNCGILGLTPIDIAISNLEITNKGILLGGFSVENLGMGVKDHCLNELTGSYNSKRDILTGGMHLTTPLFENIGGGFKVEEGLLDSIAWEFEPDLKPIPLKLGTLGVKGFYGHIAAINQPVLDIKLGGIFSDLLSADLYRIEASGRVKWPSFFEMEGKGEFLRPILNELPFQLKGEVKMSVDIPDERLSINFDGKCGILNDDLWLIDGIGRFNFSIHDNQLPTFSGSMNGSIGLPKLSDNPPFNWLNAIYDFPIEGKTENNFTHNYPTLVTGIATFKTASHGPYSLKYVLDITKKWYQLGYIRFPDYQRIEEFVVTSEKSGLLTSNIINTFTVPEDNEFGVIEIKSNEKVPTSSITSPVGKKYSESSTSDNILYSESKDKKEAFWTLLAADPGDWSITLENPAQNDSVITYFQLKEKDFKFSMNQTGDTVTVSWDVAQVEEGQTVNLMLDDDNADFDGFRITEGQATLGRLSFILDENTPDCNYYLFVQLIDENSVVQAYAKDEIDNPLATLAPPENLSSEYNSETGEFDFTWTENPTSEITGYILSVTDELGNDSVYAILNSNQTNISLFIEEFETKSAKIEAYNQDWKIGCPTTSFNLTTSIDNNLQIEEPDNKLNVFPNPTTGNLTMRYYVSEDSNCEIRIFDIQGRQIAQPLAEYKSAGFHQLNFNYKHVPNGLYIIKFINDYQTFTVKSIFE